MFKLQVQSRFRLLHLVLCALIISTILTASVPHANAQPTAENSTCGQEFPHINGAVGLICMPPEGQWNGDLVVYAPGYVDPNEPVGIPYDQLTIPPGDPQGTSIPGVINGLGFAFAMTSYSTNGLAIKDGLAELIDLVGEFERRQSIIWFKILGQGQSGQHINIPSLRYGHCNFSPAGVLAAFAVIVWRVEGQVIPVEDIARVLPGRQEIEEYRSTVREHLGIK